MAPSDAPAELDAFRRRHPGTRFVDVLLADLCGIPRGKRITIEELPGIYAGGFLLPGSMFALDVLGGTIEETGLGFDERSKPWIHGHEIAAALRLTADHLADLDPEAKGLLAYRA